METIFVTLDARQITARGAQSRQKICVGQETVCQSAPPRRTSSAAQEGKVLDFEACRQVLAEKAREPEAPPTPAEPEPEREPVPPRRRWDLALAADITASVGVLAVLAAVAARFFLG